MQQWVYYLTHILKGKIRHRYTSIILGVAESHRLKATSKKFDDQLFSKLE